jgi:hypothetical protein
VRHEKRPVVKEIVDKLHDLFIARHALQFRQHRVDLLNRKMYIFGSGETR